MSEKRRCAIYVRTSSEEGLSQDFNSLHAQAEACAAYITSQRSEGWRALPELYEDGGYSGGSMDRPALRRLMADIEAKRVDIVVVYKVDRLTRSLADFAKIVEIMGKAGASFVSVTQAFNTTTSMGRLTLNVLLSFAQFEREVTGERIRDKFAASKAKGMWMGGNPPLGYDVKDRALVVNETEAEKVRFIFRRFLEIGSVHGLMRDLEVQGVHTKERMTARGACGGIPFRRGGLYWLLGNPLYRGVVSHKGKVYPGQHEAIIDQDLWDKVQALRSEISAKQGKHHASDALLVGRVFDDRGNPMAPSHTQKRGRRYRYYVSTALTRGRPSHAGSLKRIAMAVLDRAVIDAVAPLVHPNWEADLAERLRARVAVLQIELASDSMTIDLKPAALKPSITLNGDVDGERVRIVRPMTFARPRNSTILIEARSDAAVPDRALIRGIAMAHAWMARLNSGEAKSVAALAKSDGLCPIYTARLLPLAYLAPDLTAQILEGGQPRAMTLTALTAEPLPHDWAKQRARFQSFL